MAAAGGSSTVSLPTMKRLLILRHAKSDWNTGASTDRARPLNRRGTDAAITMGRVLAKVGEIPDLIYTSPAVRARETALLAADAGDWGVPTVEVEELYETSPAAALAVAGEAPDDVELLMLVGHEPTWSFLVQTLTGATVHLKTATVAAVDLPIARWSDAPRTTGTLAYLLQARLFTDWEL
jgi:phosphohistidine phosphatase